MDLAFEIISEECRPLLEVRPLQVIDCHEKWGAGLVLENPGKASLRMFADFRDMHTDVEFLSPDHLNPERTFPTWPHCDDAHNRLSLWEALKADGLDNASLYGAFNPISDKKMRSFIRLAIQTIIERYLYILDGDFSIADRVAKIRSSGAVK